MHPPAPIRNPRKSRQKPGVLCVSLSKIGICHKVSGATAARLSLLSRGSMKGETMPRTTRTWHSIKSGVHHNNTNCNTGNNIERENVRLGTGGKPLCSECAYLNRVGR